MLLETLTGLASLCLMGTKACHLYLSAELLHCDNVYCAICNDFGQTCQCTRAYPPVVHTQPLWNKLPLWTRNTFKDRLVSLILLRHAFQLAELQHATPSYLGQLLHGCSESCCAVCMLLSNCDQTKVVNVKANLTQQLQSQTLPPSEHPQSGLWCPPVQCQTLP